MLTFPPTKAEISPSFTEKKQGTEATAGSLAGRFLLPPSYRSSMGCVMPPVKTSLHSEPERTPQTNFSPTQPLCRNATRTPGPRHFKPFPDTCFDCSGLCPGHPPSLSSLGAAGHPRNTSQILTTLRQCRCCRRRGTRGTCRPLPDALIPGPPSIIQQDKRARNELAENSKE